MNPNVIGLGDEAMNRCERTGGDLDVDDRLEVVGNGDGLTIDGRIAGTGDGRLRPVLVISKVVSRKRDYVCDVGFYFAEIQLVESSGFGRELDSCDVGSGVGGEDFHRGRGVRGLHRVGDTVLAAPNIEIKAGFRRPPVLVKFRF